MATSKPTTKAESAADKVLVQKWGRNAMATGFTALPNVLIQNAKALDLTHIDLLILLHLASFWWSLEQKPWPSKQKLADALNIDPSTVRRSIQKMQAKGLVKRIYRRADAGDNLSNVYDLSGLVAQVDKLAVKEIKRREERARDDAARKTTRRTLEVIKGGKE